MLELWSISGQDESEAKVLSKESERDVVQGPILVQGNPEGLEDEHPIEHLDLGG